MPQPPLDVKMYLSTALPALREQFPPGTGGTGQRADWPEGTLKGVQVIDGFTDKVQQYTESALPAQPITPHPAYKYPKFLQAISSVRNPIKSPSDLQKCLSTLPLNAIASVLTALDADPADLQAAEKGAQALDKAGYESDGGEEVAPAAKPEDLKTKPWYWQFSKSPMGSGEFLLMRDGSDDVHLVVRTINSAAFTSQDWDEYIVTGPYRYSTKSKASWYWSRSWGACRRLKCRYWILTDWQHWAFGCFDEPREHGWVSEIVPYDATGPSVLEALMYWCKTATGDKDGFKPEKKDVSGSGDSKTLFPDNPARRVSTSHTGGTKPRDARQPKAANESDIEESDAEDAGE